MGFDLDAPRVTVESTGSGERQLLAYQDIGNQQSVTVTVTQGFSQDAMAKADAEAYQPHSTETATTMLPLDGEVEEASEASDGQQPATRNAFFTVGVPEYSGTEDISSAEGFQFGWRANDDGQASSMRLAAAQGATDEARSMTEQAIVKLTSLPVVFPTEEIGEGAVWTVESRVTGETSMLQVTTYTLESFDGSVATVSVDVEQRPSLGALSLEGTGSDQETLDVLSSTTESEGTLTVDLGQPLPVSGSVAYDTKIVYGTEDADNSVVQVSTTELEFAENE